MAQDLTGKSAPKPKGVPNWLIAALIVVPVVGLLVWFVTHSSAFTG